MNKHNTRYILGFPEMDVQHDYCYRLFDMIDLVASGNDNKKFGRLLHEIERYLMFHFECEEHLMKMYGAPGFAVHQTDHENAGRRLVGFLDDFDAGTLNPVHLSIFLTGWLMEHSATADREYVSWILSRRLENIGSER
jgi:hemerythrin-like metal-binding protein